MMLPQEERAIELRKAELVEARLQKQRNEQYEVCLSRLDTASRQAGHGCQDQGYTPCSDHSHLHLKPNKLRFGH